MQKIAVILLTFISKKKRFIIIVTLLYKGEIKIVYVCSDLHGCPIEKFKKLLVSVNFSPDDTLYVLGDVIGRDPDGINLLRWMMIQPNMELILESH